MVRVVSVRFLLLALGWCLMLWMPASFAHEGHAHTPVNMKSALELALKTADDYTRAAPPFAAEPLAASWRGLPQSAASLVENGIGYYRVQVVNTATAELLLLKITLDGDIATAELEPLGADN